MNLFYTSLIESGIAILDEEETTHCIKVFRHQIGDEVHVTNGKGGLYKAQVMEAGKKKCVLQIIETLANNTSTIPLHIAIAPTKNTARTEWFLEKATEAGISTITPIFCQHSERQHLNKERLIRVMIAAMKQSLQCHLPILNEPQHFKDFVKLSNDSKKLIAVCENETVPFAKELKKKSAITVIIGPEGDFSNEEIQLAKANQYIPVSFGSNRFRTESAAIYSAFIIHHFNQ